MAETKRRTTPAKKATKAPRAKAAAPANDASITDRAIADALANITIDEAREPVASITESSIAERAYQRWIERGRPLSDGREDWFAACADLQA